MTVQAVTITNREASTTPSAGNVSPCGPEHVCTCQDNGPLPIVLDARAIPHAVRHAAVIGALSSLHPGVALDLIAPHNPLPLLAEVDREFDGAFLQRYVTKGPEEWTVRFTRG